MRLKVFVSLLACSISLCFATSFAYAVDGSQMWAGPSSSLIETLFGADGVHLNMPKIGDVDGGKGGIRSQLEAPNVDDSVFEKGTSINAQEGENTVNVKDFGAKGDGVTDDTNAINKALRQSRGSSEVVTVIVPSGTYIVKSYLFIFPDTKLSLASDAVIRAAEPFTERGTMLGSIHLDEDGNNCDPSQKRCTHGGYSQAGNITIEGGTWDRAANGVGNAACFRLIHGNNIVIRNTTLMPSTDHFINVSGSQNVRVENVTFRDFNFAYMKKTYSDNGLPFQNEAVHTDCIKSSDAVPDGYPADNTVSRNVTVTGCSFINVSDGVGTHYPAKSVPMSSNITVSNCTFKNLYGRAVNIYRSNGFTFKDSRLEDSGALVVAQSSKCYIRNNSANNVRKADGNKMDGDGIKILGSMQGTEITGNQIGDAEGHGIWIVDGKATISDNVSVSTRQLGSFVFDIYLSGGASGTVIKNNQLGLRGFKSNTNDVTVSGNNFNRSSTWKLQRLFGNGRYDTMEAIVKAGDFPVGGTVIVATGANYKDALAAAGLAGAENAPVILVDGRAANLNSQAKRQLQRLKPEKIYIAGGTFAVSTNIENQIRSAAGVTPIRLAGNNAVQTSVELALAGRGKWSTTAIVATTKGFKDALSVAPIAFAKKMPIFLSNNGTSVSANTLSAMKSLGIEKVIVVGGQGAVQPSVVRAIAAAGITCTENDRLGGKNGAETSKIIAQWGLKNGMSADKMGVATSQNYPDALAGAALCGFNNAVLVLADDNASLNSKFPRPYRFNTSAVYVFGGTFAVQDKTFCNLAASLC